LRSASETRPCFNIDMLTFFLQGAIAGLAIAIPVGSSSALTMTIGARYGWKPGLAAGAGSGLVLGVFAFLAVFLGKLVSPVIQRIAPVLQWVSFAILLTMGVFMLLGAVKALKTANSGADSKSDDTSGGALNNPWKAFVVLVTATLANPVAIVYFATLVLSLPPGINNPQNGVVFCLGVLLPSLCWMLLLSLAGVAIGMVLKGRYAQFATGAFGGCAIIALAVWNAF
jgi:threonine/homoserine/homoserine lactone efflux protein